MNKQELVNQIVIDTGLSKKAISTVIESLIKTVKQEVTNGESITLVGFGTFGSKLRKARLGRNPRTGEEIQIPEQKVPYFTPTGIFKEMVSKR